MNSVDRDRLIDELSYELSHSMQKEIDQDIIWNLLKESGWTQISLKGFRNNRHAIDVLDWLYENCKYKYEKVGCHFIFENEKDAVAFALKWV